MLIQDEKQTHTFWTKPRPWVFVLIVGMELLNFTCGPKFFFDLGVLYKARGWTEASRFLLRCSSFANPWSPYGQKADRYRRARLPKNAVPHSAQEKNIDAYNLDQEGKSEEAVALFESLIKSNPDFEWPYLNLAMIRLEHGKLDEAENLCLQAVKINPDYANAHFGLAQVYELEKKEDVSEKHRLKAESLLKDLPAD